jgi:branched-chain amino acid transport system permease protein
VLLGGAGTVIGPFIGTLFMFYLIDSVQRDHHRLHADRRRRAGVADALRAQGLAGELRRRIWGWLP